MVTLFEVEHTLRLFNRYYKANIISDDLWIVYTLYTKLLSIIKPTFGISIL